MTLSYHYFVGYPLFFKQQHSDVAQRQSVFGGLSFYYWCHAAIIASINCHLLDGRLRCAKFFKRNHKYSMVFRYRMFPVHPRKITDYIFAQYSKKSGKIFLLEGRMMSMYFVQFSVRSMTRRRTR